MGRIGDVKKRSDCSDNASVGIGELTEWMMKFCRLVVA